MLFLDVTRSDAGRCRRWRLRVTLQGMHRSHLRQSTMLTDDTGVIGVMACVGRGVSVQRQCAVSRAAIPPGMAERIVGRVMTRNLWRGYCRRCPILARSFTQRSYTESEFRELLFIFSIIMRYITRNIKM